jgi:DNA-binding transcriptional LysR family regulator
VGKSCKLFDFRDLECFLAVVEHKTFSRAAQALHMAQPPLSRRIADLEKALGTTLFVRGSRQVALTQAGLTLAREARVVLQQVKLAERIVRDSIDGTVGHIRLGYVGSAGFDIVPRAARRFREENPAASVSLMHIWTHQSDALRLGTIDIAIVSGIVAADGCRCEIIGTGSLIAALPADHPLVKNEIVRIADLAQEPFVELPRYGPAGMHDFVRSVFLREGFVPKVVQQAEGHDMLIACVAAGHGVALVNSAARRLPVRGVAYRDITPESPPVHLSALCREAEENPLVPSLIAALKSAYADVSGELGTLD